MSPKRASPLDEPPSASSSEVEEETSSEAASSSEEDDQPPKLSQPLCTEKKPSAKKSPPAAAPLPKSQPKASASESATESDTGSDSDDERPGQNSDLVVKPIATKPKEETTKAKKSKSKSKSQTPVSPAKPGDKRASDSDLLVTDSKKSKKVKDAAGTNEAPAVDGDGKKARDESKKLFQRLWSEEDEIAILTGLVEYAAKTGEAQPKDMNKFHDFIKKSVHVDVSKEQMVNKIWTLKRKYRKNAQRGKNGEGPNFSKPFDKKLFELSKVVWTDGGASGGMDITKSTGKAKKKNMKESSSFVPSQKPEAKPESGLVSDSNEAREVNCDRNASSPLGISEMIRFNKSLGLSGFGDEHIKIGYELIGSSKKAELEERWKKLQIAEMELFVKRTDLIMDEARLIWEANQSSSD